MTVSIPDWTLISSDTNPHDTLKSASYCSLKTTEFDSGLTLRAQSVTARMIAYLNGATWVDSLNPQPDLVEACMTQVTYEHKQRETPGMSNVTYKDGNVAKMAVTGDFLSSVKKTLDRYRRLSLVESSSQFS